MAIKSSANRSEDPSGVIALYHSFLEDPEMSTPVAVFKALTDFCRDNKAPTMSEFMVTLEQAAQSIRNESQSDSSSTTKHQHKATIASLAGVDLFMRFVTRHSHDFSASGEKERRSSEARSFEEFKKNLLHRAQLILEKAFSARLRAAEVGAHFVHDNSVVLVHAYSRVVMSVLHHAANVQNKRFKVYVTEGRPNSDGLQAVDYLREAGIPCRAVLDSAVGYIMDKVDMVFVGAEGVVENGGSIEKIGTYQIALVAKSLGKPVYAVAESYKFVRVYPLNQYDLPSATPEIVSFTSRRKSFSNSQADTMDQLTVTNPSVDYTPPQYFTLLLTDLGVLTPSGVSDELIKLYL
ncbi:putative initiation factor [Dichotomocladium elegans]|nr:putative initiation factor [Dichotomocladium elegans]